MSRQKIDKAMLKVSSIPELSHLQPLDILNAFNKLTIKQLKDIAHAENPFITLTKTLEKMCLDS